MPISGSNRQTRCRSSYRPQQGFSLLEMVLVVALLAGVSAMATTAFAPATSRARLRSEAAEISALLANARNRAITERVEMRLILDARTQTIVSGEPAMLRQLPATLSLSVTSAGEILFFPDGSSSGSDFEVSDGVQAVVFHVDWLTGRISTQSARLHAG